MKIFLSAKSALLASTAAFALLVTGCSNEGTNPSPTPEAVGTYIGQDLPEMVEELEGTPIYSESVDLAPHTELKGATYLLIAPQDPLKALLVVEEDANPEDVAKRKSAMITLTGKRETLSSDTLAKHIKDEYQLDLKTDDKGQVVVLRVTTAKAPAAAATSDSAPAAETPKDESTPEVE